MTIETRCPLCAREKLKSRVAHGPPMSTEETTTGVCLHPAHIYDFDMPPCESIGVRRIVRLRDALIRYGEHDGDCAASVFGAAGDSECTCGYDAACEAQS